MTVLWEGARICKYKLLWGINRPNGSDPECIQSSTLSKCLTSVGHREL